MGKESLDRTNDAVYESTTAVVRSVMSLTQKAPSTRADELVDLIKVRIKLQILFKAKYFVSENVPFLNPCMSIYETGLSSFHCKKI